MNTQNTSWKEHLLPDLATFRGKRVILRVDWNLPFTGDSPTDTSRFDVTVPFLQNLSFAGAKVIILSHFGEKGESILPVATYAKEKLPFITWNSSMSFDELEQASYAVENGACMLLENVRLFEGETENLPSLARSYSRLGEIFINDAFSVSHRKHASVVGIADITLSYIGPTCARELENLTKALTPEQPALLIIGGAKISTKLSLIKHYLDQGVRVFVGGAMVHNIWKSRGLEIGTSLFDPTYELVESFYSHPLLYTPADVILNDGTCVKNTEIPSDKKVVDCGPETTLLVQKMLADSKTVIVNGPLGLYEEGWVKGSEGILRAVVDAHITSYVGGGDTVSVAHTLGVLDSFTFVSLGGGAMLDFLASGTLPGIDAVTK